MATTQSIEKNKTTLASRFNSLVLWGLAAMSLTLASCLQVESTITLNKDGSGTVTEDMVFGEQMVAMLQMAQAQAGAAGGGQDPMAEMLDKKKAEARAKKMGEGVELVSVKKIDADGKMGVQTVFKFSDINKLKYSSSSAMGEMEGVEVDEENGGEPSFKYADGKLTIVQKHPEEKAEGDKEDAEAADDEMDEQSMAMMQGMMKDMRMTMKIKLAPGIKKTNATYVDGDTVTMADIQFGKLLKDPKKLKALQTGDFDKAKEALKGIDGIKFEMQESVEIELK